MSYNSGQKINTNDIVNRFVSNVINIIVSGAKDRSSIGTASATGERLVPTSYLDSIGNITSLRPNIGSSNTIIKSYINSSLTYSAIYNAFIYITKYMLKVGGYKFTEFKMTKSGNTNYQTYGGKCIFTDSAVLSALGRSSMTALNLSGDNYPSSSGNVQSQHICSITNLNSLMSLCVNMWRNSSKPYYTATRSYCYEDCHSNCHTDCDTYVDECYGGPCNDPFDHDGCYGNGSYVCGSGAENGYSCNANTYDGSLCHTDTGSNTSGGGTSCHTNSSSLGSRTGDPSSW